MYNFRCLEIEVELQENCIRSIDTKDHFFLICLETLFINYELRTCIFPSTLTLKILRKSQRDLSLRGCCTYRWEIVSAWSNVVLIINT